jgi:hypothetical protein
MKPIGSPGFVYRPWSSRRRQAASLAAEIRIYGSPEKARKARQQKLRDLIAQRDRLINRLGVVRANIAHLQKYFDEESREP